MEYPEWYKEPKRIFPALSILISGIMVFISTFFGWTKHVPYLSRDDVFVSGWHYLTGDLSIREIGFRGSLVFRWFDWSDGAWSGTSCFTGFWSMLVGALIIAGAILVFLNFRSGALLSLFSGVVCAGFTAYNLLYIAQEHDQLSIGLHVILVFSVFTAISSIYILWGSKETGEDAEPEQTETSQGVQVDTLPISDRDSMALRVGAALLIVAGIMTFLSTFFTWATEFNTSYSGLDSLAHLVNGYISNPFFVKLNGNYFFPGGFTIIIGILLVILATIIIKNLLGKTGRVASMLSSILTLFLFVAVVTNWYRFIVENPPHIQLGSGMEMLIVSLIIAVVGSISVVWVLVVNTDRIKRLRKDLSS